MVMLIGSGCGTSMGVTITALQSWESSCFGDMVIWASFLSVCLMQLETSHNGQL